MFYTKEYRIGTQGTEYRFLVTTKKKWKNFTTKNRA
jgi:hypothetical protein